MARKKYKLTGFARFFMVMLFLVPVAYLTALYINGGEEALQDLFNSGPKEKTTITTTSSSKSKSQLEKQNQVYIDSIRTLNLEIQELKRENRLLKNAADNN